MGTIVFVRCELLSNLYNNGRLSSRTGGRFLFQKNIKTQTIMKKIKQMRNDNIVISSLGTP